MTVPIRSIKVFVLILPIADAMEDRILLTAGRPDGQSSPSLSVVGDW